MDQYNLYYYIRGKCILHQNCGLQVLYVPTVGTLIEVSGMKWRVKEVVYMPTHFRFDIEVE